TAGFVAEFLTFLGAWSSAHPWWLFPGVIGAFLTAVYVLRVTKQIFWSAQGPEWAALGILIATLVIFGVAPWIAVGTIDTATTPLVASLPKVVSAVAGGGAMTFDIGMPMVPEVALFVLAVLVLL